MMQEQADFAMRAPMGPLAYPPGDDFFPNRLPSGALAHDTSEVQMGQLLKPTALVVEDDGDQRALVAALLEECDLKVVECETAEAAAVAMEHLRDTLVMIFVDVNLAGHMNGVELALLARQKLPHVSVVLTSGSDLSDSNSPKIPADTLFMQKPWRALDLLRAAESARN
jgi:two-component system cell cycle response regulator CpdR